MAVQASEMQVLRLPQIHVVSSDVWAKRALDILLASTALLVLLPVFLLITLAMLLSSPGPVFYNSLRIGKNYKPFYMLKFRTMRTNADAMRDQLRAEANLKGQLFKIKDDPRVTPFGKWLRATSLDELPQLINVLKGEMSLVGPRPLPPDESDLFEAPYTIRFGVYPGITGAWQVGGRSSADLKKLCQLEYNYIRNWSLWKDIEILCATVPAVLRRKGAY